jgi:hypothetical protein
MYKIKKSFMGKIISCISAAAMLLSMSAVSAFATAPTDEGEYKVDATLSCYVSAMGGVEFSDGYGLLKDASVTVADDGTAKATLNLGTSTGLSIYTVACTAFIGTDETPGYYKNGEVTKENVTYTVSEDTAANKNGQVNYITSITFPVDKETSEYTMWLYLDSNIMGCQLGDGSGTGSSNTPGVATAHTAKLTIDWDSAEKIAVADETSSQSATVEYVVGASYEVEIPSTITVDSATGKGTYTVAAKNFTIGENAYVTVTASESGTLSNGSDELSFTNTLSDGSLTKTDDTLSGTVEVTTTPSNPGKYTGTIDFTINYFAGE